jgi:hypothetical protein
MSTLTTMLQWSGIAVALYVGTMVLSAGQLGSLFG